MPHYSVTVPTQIFTVASTTAGVPNTCTVINEGSFPVWLGSSQGVTVNNGVQLQPGARVRFNNLSNSLWVMGTVVATSTHSITLSAAMTAGSTVAVGTAIATDFPVGTAMLVGNLVSGQEVFVTATSSATSTVATSYAAQYNHASGETVTTCAITTAQVNVQPGVA